MASPVRTNPGPTNWPRLCTSVSLVPRRWWWFRTTETVRTPLPLRLIGTPIVKLPHLESGLLALRPRRRIPLDEVLVRPDPGYERATALIAHRLLAAAKQDAVIDVVGNGVVTALEALAVARPTTWHYRIARLDQTTDVAITANERLAKAWSWFRRVNRSEEASLLAAAIELRDANDGYGDCS